MLKSSLFLFLISFTLLASPSISIDVTKYEVFKDGNGNEHLVTANDGNPVNNIGFAWMKQIRINRTTIKPKDTVKEATTSVTLIKPVSEKQSIVNEKNTDSKQKLDKKTEEAEKKLEKDKEIQKLEEIKQL